MKYFAAYEQINKLKIGNLYNSIDEVLEAATVTILEFFDDKSNKTKEVFGVDAESYFNSRIGDMYSFSIYQIDGNDAISYIRTADLWQIARLSRDTYIIKGVLSISNDTINTEFIEAITVTEYYLRIVSNLENLQRVVCTKRATMLIVDTYISIIRIKDILNIKDDVLEYQYYPDLDTFEQLGLIARGMLSGYDISFSLNLLIYYIWGLTEINFDIDFVKCISDGVKDRGEFYKQAI
ncbi:hypothetical protein [Ruoffia sp. FAM 26254]|uniref:hypothetical protein n=1 Tax=Ruoffia sp. FAM 26254 TaxID=3259518 RepID=UPI0038898ECD